MYLVNIYSKKKKKSPQCQEGWELMGLGQESVFALPLKQSPMSNSLKTWVVAQAVELSGWFWRALCPRASVSTPAAAKLTRPNQSLSGVPEYISCCLLHTRCITIWQRAVAVKFCFDVWHWLCLKCHTILITLYHFTLVPVLFNCNTSSSKNQGCSPFKTQTCYFENLPCDL